METWSPGGDMCTCEEGGVDALAGEILRYLRARSRAADSANGIAEWWIKRQRLEDCLVQVQFALDRLVAADLIEARITPAGKMLYRLPLGMDETDVGASERT